VKKIGFLSIFFFFIIILSSIGVMMVVAQEPVSSSSAFSSESASGPVSIVTSQFDLGIQSTLENISEVASWDRSYLGFRHCYLQTVCFSRPVPRME